MRRRRITRLLVTGLLGMIANNVWALHDKNITESRFIPIQVTYAFTSQSEIHDPKLVQIKKIRIFKQGTCSMFYVTVLNKTNDPVDVGGDIYFYDKQGKEVFVVRSTAVGEFVGQATPGISEGVDMPGNFETVDIRRIVKAKVIVRGAFADNENRD